ncbi:sensor histidine kinase [Sphingobium estronivorans]|uniref:sensor histidine kinase n=1 Tax=Sphingobium estronivorans TaxID=1577690 RepID=UPI00123AEFA2|nr:sensor histidine kinase [Sphingobium estronivorans]
MPSSTKAHIAGPPSRLVPTNRHPASLPEILHELFRIACKADAYEIHVETFVYEGRATLSVYDNGCGIDDPRTVLRLGAFGRCETERSDAIALSSLVGLHTIVRSGPDETEPGWSATIPPEAWSDKAPITIEPDAGLRGTNILVAIPIDWRAGLEEAVAAAARDLPARVYFHARWKNRR